MGMGNLNPGCDCCDEESGEPCEVCDGGTGPAEIILTMTGWSGVFAWPACYDGTPFSVPRFGSLCPGGASGEFGTIDTSVDCCAWVMGVDTSCNPTPPFHSEIYIYVYKKTDGHYYLRVAVFKETDLGFRRVTTVVDLGTSPPDCNFSMSLPDGTELGGATITFSISV